MDSFGNQMRKRLSEKFLGKQAIGAVTMQVVRKYYALSEEELSWYVKFQTLFLQFTDHQQKVQAYKQQQDILNLVNQTLQKLGYTQKLYQLRFL
jgi:hypothetical protein